MSVIKLLIAFALFAALIGSVEARTFTDANGRKIEAELLGVSGTEVRIRKGGKDYTLPIARFSEADQKYIRTWASKESENTLELKLYPAGSKPEATKPKRALQRCVDELVRQGMASLVQKELGMEERQHWDLLREKA